MSCTILFLVLDLNIDFYFKCLSALCACMCFTCLQCTLRPGEITAFPGAVVIDVLCIFVFTCCGHMRRLEVIITCFLQLEGQPASYRVPLASTCQHASSAPCFYVGATDRKPVLLLLQQVLQWLNRIPIRMVNLLKLAFIMIPPGFGTRAIFWNVCPQSASSHTPISHSEPFGFCCLKLI